MTALASAAPALDVALHDSIPLPEAVPFLGRAVYLIGIGGSGMSGLARMLRSRGAIVRGSDSTVQDTTEALRAEGITIDADQTKARLPEVCDLVVASAAIKADHPQMLAARERGIRVMTYAQALGQCMLGRTGVSIAGTHGKSTTTSMLGCVLADAGIDPTVIVGATCKQLGGGFRLGSATIPGGTGGTMRGRPGVLVAESCEFDRSFHNYFPVLAAITAVEADHLDYYGSLDAVVESFNRFARQIAPASEGGRLLIGHDGAHRREVTAGVRAMVETIGFSPAADWVVRFNAATRGVELLHEGQLACAWTCNLPGEHNAMNGATAAALAIMLGADPASISRTLTAFRGVDRRSQLLGTRTLPGGAGEVKVYDDYGHHPTEVEATLRALRAFEKPQDRGGRLICIFQPHQHSRTRHLLEEFANAFSSADLVIVPDIYFVRDSEQERHLISAGDLVDRLRSKGVSAMHLYPFGAIVDQLPQLCRANDLVVVMGAGPVWQIGRDFLLGR